MGTTGTSPPFPQKAGPELPMKQMTGGSSQVWREGVRTQLSWSHRWRIIAEPLTVSLRWRQMSCEIQYLEFALQNCTCKKQNINRSEKTRERSETQVTLGHHVGAGAGRSAHLAEG